jgi:CRISPR-associated protein Cas1
MFMVRSKVSKLILDGHGSYLGMEKGCLIVKDKQDTVERYPLFEKEIGEIVLKSGNLVSTGALSSLGFWGIDVLITTQRGRPVAMLKSLDDDSHVQTRLCQYDAVKGEKWFDITKQFVIGKFLGQNSILEKYDLDFHNTKYIESIESTDSTNRAYVRRRLMAYESKFTKHYFTQIFQLFPKSIRPEVRRSFKAYDGTNNLFNLAYEMLSWKVHRALIHTKLEPYLGFLHSTQFGKPSLVCDVQELYRHLMDDFLIQYCQNLRKKDFVVKTEDLSRKKKGKRVYLNDSKTRNMMKKLNEFFESYIEIPRLQVGKKQTIETLITEEALVFAKFLRDEQQRWIPRLMHSYAYDHLPEFSLIRA